MERKKLRKVLQVRLRERILSEMNKIGNVTATLQDIYGNFQRIYKGKLYIGVVNNLNQAIIQTESKMKVRIPCSELYAYNIIGNTIKFQLKGKHIFELCSMQLRNQQQVEETMRLISIK